jgi:hypothetical protein
MRRTLNLADSSCSGLSSGGQSHVGPPRPWQHGRQLNNHQLTFPDANRSSSPPRLAALNILVLPTRDPLLFSPTSLSPAPPPLASFLGSPRPNVVPPCVLQHQLWPRSRRPSTHTLRIGGRARTARNLNVYKSWEMCAATTAFPVVAH